LGGASDNADSAKGSFIAKGLVIVGEIRSEGKIIIDGEIEGTVTASEVVVSQSGKVNGPINAGNVSISGTVQGTVIAKTALSLMAGAKVIGDLETAQLSVEKGAVLRGKCSMCE
jgi:cytoskeletal protein CcmA (bactofilin family)